MAYSIRSFRSEDAQSLVSLTLRAIYRIGPKSYSNQQVAAWAALATTSVTRERFVSRWSAGDHIFVVTNTAREAVAYAVLEPGENGAAHLDMLYCHPDHSRRGLADRLLAHCEATARAAHGEAILTQASELARPAFERAGYTVENRREITVRHKAADVIIHNFGMVKRLTG